MDSGMFVGDRQRMLSLGPLFSSCLSNLALVKERTAISLDLPLFLSLCFLPSASSLFLFSTEPQAGLDS